MSTRMKKDSDLYRAVIYFERLVRVGNNGDLQPESVTQVVGPYITESAVKGGIGRERAWIERQNKRVDEMGFGYRPVRIEFEKCKGWESYV